MPTSLNVTIYVAHHLARILLSVVGIVLIVATIKKELSRRIYHRNAKMLLVLHYVCVICSAVGVLITSSVSLWPYMFLTVTATATVKEQSGSHSYPVTRSPLNYIFVFGNNAAIIAFISLAVERSWSTINAKRYENSKSVIGITLSICSVTIGILSILLLIFSPPQYFLVVAAVILYTLAIVEVINIFIFITLYLYNVRWKRHRATSFATLSHKYQVEENVASVTNLLPIALVHTLCNLVTCIATAFLIMTRNTQLLPKTYADFIPLYYILLPILVRRKHSAGMLGSRKSWNQTGPLNEQGDTKHFELLNKLFGQEYFLQTRSRNNSQLSNTIYL